jgi:CTP synthase (UTP-ammonia lyase)
MTTTSAVRIALIGDYDPSVPSHQAIPMALKRAGDECSQSVEFDWVGTDTITDAAAQLAEAHAIWCVPASPYRSTAGALAAIRFARETGRPFLGTCGGFQHALLEYAQNVLGLNDAAHAETEPDAVMPLISLLSCSLVEKSDDILLEPGSRITRIFGATTINEGYRCRYGLNHDYESLFADTPLCVCGRDRAARCARWN